MRCKSVQTLEIFTRGCLSFSYNYVSVKVLCLAASVIDVSLFFSENQIIADFVVFTKEDFEVKKASKFFRTRQESF